MSKTLDEGSYKCSAKNPQGELVTRTMAISVLVPPLIDPFTFPRILYEGMRARLTCVVTQGDLPIAFSWLKDGQVIPADVDATIRQDDHFSSSITFPSITTRHSGNYSCIAKNTAATVNHTATLVVNVPPRWEVQPSDKSAAFHTSVSFDCKAEGTPTPKITWKKAWGRGPGDYRDVIVSSHNARILQNDTLLLERVTEQDKGYYLCEAGNGVGTGLSKVIYLTVHAAAYFDVKVINQTARKGHSAHLTCTAKGDLPMDLVWIFKGSQVSLKGENSRFSIRERRLGNGLESELTIGQVSRGDSGSLQCLASNAYGRDEASVSLIVQEPPDAPDQVRVIDHGSRTVQLEWSPPYDGNTQIQSYIVQFKLTSEEWRLGAQNVTVVSAKAIATVHGLLPGMAYNFRVLARNAAGYGEPSTSVEIATSEEAPSGSPLEVEAIATGPQALKVTWKSPKPDVRNGEILGYYVGYRMYDSSEPYIYETVAVSRGPSEEVSIKNLKKFTKYSVTVKAFNGVGTGPNSDEIIAFTSEDVPNEPPQSVHCSSLGTQSLHVTWEPPPSSAQNGILKGYKIFYTAELLSDRHKQDNKFVVISAKSHETTLTGLEKYANYSIQVAALTQVGDGIKSEPRFCRTREDVPGPPGDVKALLSSSTSVLIAWRAPKKPNGTIKKYNVYWSAVQEGHKRAVKLGVPSHGELIYDIQGLIENSRYEFWVTASTSVGEGESTSVVSQAPHHKVPARVASFPEVVVAAWKSLATLPCLAVGTPVITRGWKSRGKKLVLDEHYSVLENGTLVIDGVQRQDVGNFSCKVENIYGFDEISHELVVLAPPLPPNLLIHKTTPNSIVLTWKIREESSNPIRAYKLKYKRDFGGWEEFTVDADQDHAVLKNLHCGTRYQVALQAENSIGHGEASKMITVTTKGSVPRIPLQANVLRVNTTTVTLRLGGWPDGGCPVRHFVVQYRPKSHSDFTLVSNNVIPEHEFVTIGDLQAGVPYVLRITAHNDAGSVEGQYEFVTTSSNADNFAADDAKLIGNALGFETSIIVAVTVPALLIVGVLVVVCLVIRRKKYHQYQQSMVNNTRQDMQTTQGLSETPEKRNLQSVVINRSMDSLPEAYSPTRGDKRSSLLFSVNHEDVCPYATFNLTRGHLTSSGGGGGLGGGGEGGGDGMHHHSVVGGRGVVARAEDGDPDQHLHLQTFAENEGVNKSASRHLQDNKKQAAIKRPVFLPNGFAQQNNQSYRFGALPTSIHRQH